VLTPDYRDALREYLYSSPSDQAWRHFCRSSFDYVLLTYTSSLVSTVIFVIIFAIILPILSYFWTPGFIDGYRVSEVKQAQRPLPSNESQDIVILQCPNAAGSGSTMVVCGPLSGSPVTFIVPLGVEAGDYFELEEWVDGTVTCSRIDQPHYPSPPTNLTLWLRLFYRFRLYYFLPCIPGGILKNRPTSDYLVTYFAFPFFGWAAVSDPGVARYLHKSMKNAVPETTDRNRSPGKVIVPTEAFEFIKGFGCLQVFLGHYQLWTKVDYGHDNGMIREADFGGGSAVFMFFIMSGMLLTIGYASRAEASLPWAWDFMLMRFSRLAPSCWFALSLFIPFIFMQRQYGKNSFGDYFLVEKNENIKSMLGSMFFLNGWIDLYQGMGNNYNPVLWSTTAQMYCYLWFPLLVLPLHTVRNTARFIGEVLSFYSLYLFVSLLLFWWAPPQYTFGYAVKYQGQYNYPLLHCNVHNKVPLFLMGVVAGSQALTNMPVVKSELYTLRWSYVCNSLTVLMLSLFVLEAIVGYTIHGAGLTLRLNLELVLPPVYMAWLYSFTQAPNCLAYRWCCWKPFLLMGKCSFCVYLLHFPIITYYAWARFGLEYWKTSSDATRLYAWEIIPCYVIVFMVATFVHHFIEEPSRDFTYKALSRISSFFINWILTPIWFSLTECWFMVI
jgi:peptidoglycan/LPS O-acetylase OafA/YrhL